MKVSMIAAMDHRRVIGKPGGGLPWHLPRDIRHFRDYTAGKHLLVGRRTWEEMRNWFSEEQTPIVMTHDRDREIDGLRMAHSAEEAVTEAFEDGARELVVIGGAAVFAAALPFADELVLTRVDTDVVGEGDLDSFPRFPDFESEIEWEYLGDSEVPADEENAHDLRFLTLRRVKPSSLRPGRLHLL